MMNLELPVLTSVRFHVSLNVSDLERAVRFYSLLFDTQPAKHRNDYAKFELDEPPLVLSLEAFGHSGGGALSHLGLRLADARALVAVQERLERQGIRSQREEGVECCYARQTKFWVHDPDNTLWEFYTLDDDLEHRGQGQSLDVMTNSTLPDDLATWEHRLGEPLIAPEQFANNSLDEVRLRGSFNVPLTPNEQSTLLTESLRLLKPNGRLLIRILTGESPLETPQLPGAAAHVRHVPAKDDIMALLNHPQLTGLRLLKYDDPPCFIVEGNRLRETHIEAFRKE